ncbi:hypothetical protein [Brevundimonas lutea]|uniref:hypothetical protein n=1 Tax=Brevundimonas lutea TaxID=2293980 RepID=UPI00196A88C9|nr:hypothetical protein [Brevundimonas lutea]
MLLLEVADDYGSISRGALALTQVKDTAASGSLTLVTKGVGDAINRLWRFSKANPDCQVSLTYLTTATVGKERDHRFPNDRPGLQYWRDAALDGADTRPLRGALRRLALDADLKDWIRDASDDALRDQLLRPIRFATDEPALTDLETLLSEALAHLCATAGARGADIESLRNTLVADVLRAAVASETEDRRLSRADLMNRIAETARSGLPDLGGRGGSPILDPLETTTSGALMADRPDANRALRAALSEGVAWLYGPSGIGKTALSRALPGDGNRAWFSLDLRDAAAPEAARRLRAARQELLALDTYGGLCVDDLNVTPTGSVKRELALLFAQVRLEDARVLVTAYTPVPASLQAELGLPESSLLRAPRFTEEETSALVAQAGGDVERWAKAVQMFSGGGYPQLVAARVVALRAGCWPASELARMVVGGAGGAVDDEKEGARRRLLGELPPTAASLLYRISLISGAFDRSLALSLAEVSPAIPEAGAALDLLKGPWLEPLAGGRLRVSPLLSDAGIKVLSEAEQAAVHTAIAEGLASKSTIDAADLPQLVLSSIRTGSKRGLKVVVHAALLQKLPGQMVARALYPLAFMRTDRPLISSAPAINRMLRFAQIKVASLDGMTGVAERAYQTLLAETDDDPPGRALRSMAAFIMTANLEEMSVGSWFPLVAGLPADAIDQLGQLRTLAPEIANEEQPWSFPVQDLGVFLFTYRSHRLQGLDDLEALIDRLESVAVPRRSVLLSGERSLGRTSDNRQIAVQSAWMAEVKREHFDSKATAVRLKAMSARVGRWPDPALEIELICARIVILAEYADRPEDALQLVEEALGVRPDSDRLRRERVKIFIRLKRFSEIAQDADRLLKDAAGQDAVEEVFAARDVAIATAEAGDIKGAIARFRAASRTAAGTTTLRSLGLRMEADVILLRWRTEDREAALRAAFGLVERVEALDDVLAGQNGPQLVRGLYMMAEVMVQDLTAPGWDAGISVVGIASRPNDDQDALPRPPLLAVWYRLAEAQHQLGIDVGVAEALERRRAAGQLVAFEVVRTGRQDWSGVSSPDPISAAAAISARAGAIAWIRGHALGGGDAAIAAEMFTVVQTMPWDGDLDPTNPLAVDAVTQVTLVSLAFALGRGDTAWLESLVEAAQDPGLASIIKAFPEAQAPVDVDRSGHTALWSLRLVSSPEHDVRDLFVATAYLSHWLSELPSAAEVTGALFPILQAHWRRTALERRFSLITPDLTAADILSAADALKDAAGIARLLLAARSSVRVSVPPETLQAWRERAKSSVS